MTLGSLSKGIFEWRTSTRSAEVFFIFKKYFDATKFVFLSVFTIIEMICIYFYLFIATRLQLQKDAKKKNVGRNGKEA